MPIKSQPITLLEPSVGYDRMAFRCSAKVTMVGGAPAANSSMSLHGTRYRKPRAGKFDVCGLVGEGEIGATLSPGVPADTELMRGIATACIGYVGVAGDAEVELNFAWRPEAGDLVGMAMLTVTPSGGKPITRSAGNTNTLAAQDPAFAQTFGKVFSAIEAWCNSRGW